MASTLAVLLLALFAAAAGADPSTFFGVNVQPLAKLDLITGTNELPASAWNGYVSTISAAGFKVARSDALWRWVEPNAPTAGTCNDQASDYNWNNTATESGDAVPESMDSLVGTLWQNGVQFLPVFDGSPSWAQGTYPDVLEPQYYCDYANYAKAFAQRYGPGGSFWAGKTNPRPVTTYEIWTEGNSTDFWTGGYCGGYSPSDPSDPTYIPDADCEAQYAQGLGMVADAIHSVDPNAVVLASIGWQNMNTYLPQFMSDLESYASAHSETVAEILGGIAMHPYGVDTQFIIQLDEQVRSDLVTAGYPDLPIYDTEDGQPVVASDPAQYSWEGYVTDGARAAMDSLAGDALARSDCGVRDYLLYGIVGSGHPSNDPNSEPNDEGLMGLWSLNTDQATLTAEALSNSAAAYMSDPSSGIVLCGQGTTPPANLLPLGLSLTQTSPGCVSGTISYGGNPLEGAHLVLSSGGQTYYSGAGSTGNDLYGSDSTGAAQVCLPSDASGTSFDAYAQLYTANAGSTYYVAQSDTFSCPLAGGSCTDTNLPPPSSTTTTTTTTPSTLSQAVPAPPALLYSLLAKILHAGKKATKLRAQLTLNAGTPATTTLAVWLRKRGRHAKWKFLTSKTLTGGAAITFKVRPLKRGEKLEFEISANSALQRPPLTQTLRVH